MPSEKSRYLEQLVTPPLEHKDIKEIIKKISRDELESLILSFSHSDPIKRTLMAICTIEKFETSKDYKALQEGISYSLSLPDFVPYNEAGAYSNVIYPVWDFFKAHPMNDKIREVLKKILPDLENSATLLQDEESWHEVFEGLTSLL